MKKQFILLSIVILCALVLVGCGNGRDTIQEFYTIKAETETMFQESIAEESWQLLGTQFYQEKSVQLWAEMSEDKATFAVYRCDNDGNRELVSKGVSSEWFRSSWYCCLDGEVLSWSGKEIVKWGKEGQKVYHHHLDGTIWDVCQLQNGKLYLLLDNEERDKMKIVELNTETGQYDEGRSIYVDFNMFQYISGMDKDILLLNGSGLVQYHVKDGSKTELLSFRRTIYKLNQTESDGLADPSDFRVTEDGGIEVLRNQILEKLRMVDITDEKKVLILRSLDVTDTLEKAIENFNAENEKYYVVIEKCGEDEASEDFKKLTNIQLVSGKGADIIVGSAVEDETVLIEKGILEDLSPYMAQSGIQREDYFPIAFSCWSVEEKVYGINMYVQPNEPWMLKELVGEKEGLTISSFVDALIEYDEKAVLWTSWGPEKVLVFLLCGSENLWGMIDWEKRTCDFEGELFRKMLEVSKRYGDDRKNQYTALCGPRRSVPLYYYDEYEELEEEGKVAVGWLFEDGGHVKSNEYQLVAVNQDSPYKEGAWEFIEYLLKEGQSLITYLDSYYPVSKEAFEALIQREIEVGAVEYYMKGDKPGEAYKRGVGDYKKLGEEAYREKYDITEQDGENIYALLEDARAMPIKNRQILAIIYEEAAAYFTGSKTIEEVIPIIENRVQLYLEERK